jgi:hypothetical protein
MAVEEKQRALEKEEMEEVFFDPDEGIADAAGTAPSGAAVAAPAASVATATVPSSHAGNAAARPPFAAPLSTTAPCHTSWGKPAITPSSSRKESAALLPEGKLKPTYCGEELVLKSKKLIGLQTQASSGGRIDPDDLLMPDPGRHYPFLDITRIACVWCVAVDHGNGSFGKWNVMFTQDWVLQYLFIVAGASFGMTKKGLVSYELRLAVYFCLGVSINWLAWIIVGKDWKHNLSDMIFHLWFIVGLMIMTVFLCPLRFYIQSQLSCGTIRKESKPEVADVPETEAPNEAPDVSEPHEEPQEEPQPPPTCYTLAARARDSMLCQLLVIGCGYLGIGLFFSVALDPLWDKLAPPLAALSGSGQHESGWAEHWGLGGGELEARAMFDRFGLYLMCSVSNVFLMMVGPVVLPQASYTTWLMIFNTYGHKIAVDRKQDDRFFHGFDLTMLGLAAFYLGVRHRQKIGIYIVRYWFVVIFICGLIWPPGTSTRYDEHPPEELSLRVRVNLLEGIICTVWLVAGDRLIQPEIFTEDRMEFLGNWALLIFLVHKFCHMTLPPPLNWTVLVALAPAFYLVEMLRRKR